VSVTRTRRIAPRVRRWKTVLPCCFQLLSSPWQNHCQCAGHVAQQGASRQSRDCSGSLAWYRRDGIPIRRSGISKYAQHVHTSSVVGGAVVKSKLGSKLNCVLVHCHFSRKQSPLAVSTSINICGCTLSDSYMQRWQQRRLSSGSVRMQCEWGSWRGQHSLQSRANWSQRGWTHRLHRLQFFHPFDREVARVRGADCQRLEACPRTRRQSVEWHCRTIATLWYSFESCKWWSCDAATSWTHSRPALHFALNDR